MLFVFQPNAKKCCLLLFAPNVFSSQTNMILSEMALPPHAESGQAVSPELDLLVSRTPLVGHRKLGLAYHYGANLHNLEEK